MCDRHGAVVDPDLVGVGVIAVVVRVEGEPDRLVRLRLDLRDDLLRARGKVGVEHEHVVVEDHPAVVAVSLPAQIAFVEVHARRELLDGVDLAGDMTLMQKADENTGREDIHSQTLHRVPPN